MDSIKIYSSDGALLIDAVLEDSSAQDWGIMSENQVSLDFYTDECIILPASCYIDYEGQRFWLLDEYKPTENNSAEWSYQVRFLGAESLLAVTVVLKQTDGSDEPIFNLTAPASQHLEFIVSNLNRRFPGMGWSVGSVPSTENIFIEYAGTYASEALQTIVGDKYEWWVDDFVINIGRCEFGERIELGYQNGLLGGITYSTANEMRSYAYLYPIGSTRNIDPSKYGYSRLQLPNGLTRIDINPEQGLAELVESDAFADIFPRYVGKVTAVRTSSGKNEDGTSFTIYHIKDSSIPFNPNNYEIAGEVKQITFQSGELMGAEFEVNYDADNKEFEIITQFQNGGLSQLPGGALIPKVGDKYVVWNISMPDEYYPLAEQEFLQAALAFASESVKEASVYRAPVDFIEVQQRGLRLRPGQRVRLLSNEYFPDKGYYDSRITRITRDVCYPDEITIEVSSVVSKGTISRLRNSVNDSATKVASLGQSLKNYVDVMSPQSVRGVKNFVNGLSIGSVGLWRHPDGYVYLDETLVLKGGVVMYGNSSGVDVPSIFDSLPIDGYTIKRDGNGALYVDETALSVSGGGGGGGVADSVHWNNVTDKPSWIGSTKPTYKYSEIEERPDLSVYFLASNFTKTNIKSTLGISDWALASAKPTYKYSEISNTPDLSVYALNTDLAKKWTQNDAKIANWDSAYSWGNHANAGYAKASDVTNEFKNYVKLAGDSQSITAQHNFANGLKIGGISLRKVDDYLYLDSSLVLSGGVTMYGDDGTTVKPIWESIPLDDSTLAWANGELTVIGGTSSSGGGISEAFLNKKLEDYALQTWVEGYSAKWERYIDITNNSTFKSIGYGTTAYGWPYNGPAIAFGANASYNHQIQSPADKNTLYHRAINNGVAKDWVALLDSGNYSDYALPKTGGTINGVLTLNNPTSDTLFEGAITLDAKSYGSESYSQIRFKNGSEVSTRYGFINLKGSAYGHGSGVEIGRRNGDSTTIWASIDASGITATSFIGSLTGTASISGAASTILSINRTGGNNPLIAFHSDGTLVGFLGIDTDCTPCYIDPVNYGKYVLLHSGNLSSFKLSQFTDDLGYFMTKVAADTLPSLVNIAGYGYESKGWKTTGPAITFGISTHKAGFQSNYSTGALYFGFVKTSGADLGDWKRIAFTDSNVASATKLATARTIWGQSFDGTGNIVGTLNDVDIIRGGNSVWLLGISGENVVLGTSGNGGYRRMTNKNGNIELTALGGLSASCPYISTEPQLGQLDSIGSSSVTFSAGYGLYCWIRNTGNAHLQVGTDSRAGTSLSYDMVLQPLGGNVAIGGTTADAKLHVHGTAKFTGDTTFSSKVVIGTIPIYQSADGTLFVDANVVFRGGVAMHGNTTTTVNEE